MKSQLPSQEEAQVATTSMPVLCGLDACCKPLRCPGPSAVPVRGWVCLGCAHGPDSWQEVPRVAQLEVTADTLCRRFL